MIKVLIVDDTRTARAALRSILERDPEIIVVGEASNGAQTMKLIHKYDPDFVTMDIYLEHENGLDLTKTIMVEAPRPILVITGVNPKDPRLIYRAMENGALDVFPKPPGPDHTDHAPQTAQLIRLVKTLSKVPVLHQRRKRSPSFTAAPSRARDSRPGFRSQPLPVKAPTDQAAGILLIGASTGGPPVVCNILSAVSAPSPVPIVVVQHITAGFAQGFADWLQQCSKHRTVLVDRMMSLEAGTVYIAADDTDIVISASRNIKPAHTKNTRGATPNIDQLFSSAADNCKLAVTALLLTGMGSDGAAGLARLREAGAITLGQEPETCAVDSMPRSAIERGAVQRIMSPDEMAAYLSQRLKKRV